MRISQIYVYPVKSLKGIQLELATIAERGLENDRRFMLIDDDRKFITQREFPILARFETSIAAEKIEVSLEKRKIEIETPNASSEKLNVKIWKSTAKALVCKQKVNDWYSEILNSSVRLVYMPDDSKRIVNPFYSIRKYQDLVSFADGYPILLASEESLNDLNSRLESPIPMDRFRPNIVISGSEAFAEDTWKRIRIGTSIFRLMKPCERCVMTTIDQTKGEKTGMEPLKTLASFRNQNGKILFGENLIAENFGETIKLNDEVEILS